MNVPVHTRQTSHVGCVAISGAAALYPRCFETTWGSYQQTRVVAGDLWFQRAHVAGPPFAWDLQVTTVGDVTYPYSYVLGWGRSHVLYERAGPNAWLIASDDEGETWGTPVLILSAATRPFGAVCPFTGLEVVAGYKAGTIVAKRRESGDLDGTFGPEYTFKLAGGVDLQVEQDTFAFYVGHEGPSRWFLHCRPLGEGGTATYWSGDDTETWTRIA
jgi:hypothetical protein